MTSVTQPERGRGTMLPIVAAAAALIALLVFAPFASAASDPLASGTTTLKLNKGLFKKLKKNDVKVLKVSPATVKNRTVTLPVNPTGSALDPTTGQGTISQSGGLKFKRQKRSVVLKNLVIDTTKKSLSGKIGKKSMKIASVAGLSFTRDGFGVDIGIGKLKLTGKAAKQLNKKLGFSGKDSALFKKNQVIGSSSSATQPSTVAVLASGKANLATDEATVKKFVLPPPSGLGVTIEAIPPAEKTAVANPFTPILGFPISGGTIAPNASSGTLQTTGGVKLTQDLGPSGKTTMTLNAIWVDLGAKTATVEVTVESTVDPKLNLGQLGRISIADINLTGATIKSDPTARTVSVVNAVATLQAVTAATLTSVFGAPYDAKSIPHPTFSAGDGLGTFSFTAQTQ